MTSDRGWPGVCFKKRVFQTWSSSLNSDCQNLKCQGLANAEVFGFRTQVQGWFNELWIRVTLVQGDLKKPYHWNANNVTHNSNKWKKKPWSLQISPLEMADFITVCTKNACFFYAKKSNTVALETENDCVAENCWPSPCIIINWRDMTKTTCLVHLIQHLYPICIFEPQVQPTKLAES